MQTDIPFWGSPVFDGIDHVHVKVVNVASRTVEMAARGWAAG